MTERTVALSELVDEGLLEVGAGRPRSVDLERYPLPILRVADVLDGKIESSFRDYVLDAWRPEMGPKASKPGDVVLTVKGTVGRVAIMPTEGPCFAYSPQLCYFRPSGEGPLKSRYLYYWFKSVDFWRQADALKGQTDMADFLSLGDVCSLKLKLPSRAQQEGVVAVLGALDDKIASNGRIVETAESLCLASCEEQRWESRVRVEEVAVLRKEQVTPATLECESVEHFSLPAFDAGGMPDVVNPQQIKSAKFVVRAPAVLLSKLNPGTPRVWNVVPGTSLAALASTEFLVLEPLPGVDSSELWATLSQPGFMEGLAAKVTGTSKSHQRVRPLEVMGSEIVDPREIGASRAQVRSLAHRIASARSESRALAALRDSLLPQLMSGQLRVRDAERVVEDAV